MFFWKDMFKKKDVPNITYEHELLGKMEWSDDKESWVGRFNGINFWMAYELSGNPKQETLDYAVSILSDDKWLSDTLVLAKQRALQSYSSYYEEEIKALEYATFSFHDKQTILIQFFEGDDQPWWSADVVGRELRGIGFDT